MLQVRSKPAGARSARGAVVALVAIVVALIGGVGPAGAQHHHEGLIPEGHWSDDQITEMLALIEATETILPAKFPATGTYAEIDSTLGSLGFFDFGVPAPGGYRHWINAGWLFDEHLVNPEFPESLVYRSTGGGSYELVSAMFMLEPSIGMDDIPEHIAWLPGWHGHPELCINANGTFGGITDRDHPNCPEGTTQASTPLMMHVWIAEDNPCDHRFGGIGVTGVHCDHEGHGGHEGDPGHEGHEGDPGHEGHGGHEGDPGHEGHGDGGGHGDGHGGGHPHDDGMAQPATPIVAEPTYTG